MECSTPSVQLYGQIRRILVVCIGVTMLLAFSASLWISLKQDAKVRDQALLSAVQVAAGTSLLMENDNMDRLQEYVEHTVREVIYETAGGPAFDKNAIGKSIFLTREEAERASRETQGKEDADGATDKPE